MQPANGQSVPSASSAASSGAAVSSMVGSAAGSGAVPPSTTGSGGTVVSFSLDWWSACAQARTSRLVASGQPSMSCSVGQFATAAYSSSGYPARSSSSLVRNPIAASISCTVGAGPVMSSTSQGSCSASSSPWGSDSWPQV